MGHGMRCSSFQDMHGPFAAGPPHLPYQPSLEHPPPLPSQYLCGVYRVLGCGTRQLTVLLAAVIVVHRTRGAVAVVLSSLLTTLQQQP